VDWLDDTEGLGQRIIFSKGGAQADLLNKLGFPDKRYSAKSDDTSKVKHGAGSAGIRVLAVQQCKVGINIINQEASSWLGNSTFVASVCQVSDDHLDGSVTSLGYD
jgi:hypothetical protein